MSLLYQYNRPEWISVEILVGRRMNLMEYDEIQEDMSEDRGVSNEKGIHLLTVLACMDVF